MAKIPTLYESLNNLAYNKLQNIETWQADASNGRLSNELLTTLMNGLTASISEMNVSNRNYEVFQIPVSPFGAVIEQLGARLIRADDPVPYTTGHEWTDFVRSPQNIIANYISAIARSNYPLQIDRLRVQELARSGDGRAVAELYAKSFNMLWESVRHDHDLMVPFLMGVLATQQQADWIQIPATPALTATSEDILTWGIQSAGIGIIS